MYELLPVLQQDSIFCFPIPTPEDDVTCYDYNTTRPTSIRVHLPFAFALRSRLCPSLPDVTFHWVFHPNRFVRYSL